MSVYALNLAEAALENDTYRRVLHTGEHLQLVLMCLAPGQDIGEEVHPIDQFIRVEEGQGVAIAEGKETPLSDGSAVFVPAGVRHNIRNVSESDSLRLYTLYAPPNHPPGLLQQTKPAGAFEGGYTQGDADYDPRHECS
ncbi:MAG TPA: cupin domain-containing protein [Candidatus Paceibacterota bacterium]|nr:cupin domain-containing protein [Candidatus Paceibacterota bacterium]